MKRKYSNIFLKGKKIYLRMLKLQDVNRKYLSWMNSRENNHIPAATSRNTISSIKKYVIRNLKNPNVLFFAIIENNNNSHIGNIKLGPINWLDKNTEFGRLIGEKKFKRKGYGTEAVELVLKFSFNILKLHKVFSMCLKNNFGAIKSNKKNGMKIEACIKEKKFIKNKYRDIFYLGISKKDWIKKNKKKV